MFNWPPRPSFKSINLLLSGVLLCICTAGGAFAAPKVCKKDCPPLPASAETTVFWGFSDTSLFFEEGGRTCALSQLAPDFSSGTYDCVLGEPLVNYYLDPMTWTQTFKRGTEKDG